MRYLLILAALCGCATMDKIYSSDGLPAYYAECHNANSFGACYEKAQEACPMGYKTLDTHHDYFIRSLTFRCNESKAASLYEKE